MEEHLLYNPVDYCYYEYVTKLLQSNLSNNIRAFSEFEL